MISLYSKKKFFQLACLFKVICKFTYDHHFGGPNQSILDLIKCTKVVLSKPILASGNRQKLEEGKLML